MIVEWVKHIPKLLELIETAKEKGWGMGIEYITGGNYSLINFDYMVISIWNDRVDKKHYLYYELITDKSKITSEIERIKEIIYEN